MKQVLDRLLFRQSIVPENQQGEASSPNLMSPWLVFKHEMSSNNQTFYDVAGGHFHVTEIAEFKDKYICGSSHGWLVMIDPEVSDCFLFNPYTLEKIKLPTREPMTGWCILSSPPTDQYCTAVFLDGNTSCISFCHLGESEWNHVVYVDEQFLYFTVCEEKFYFLSLQGSLFVQDSLGNSDKNFKVKKLVGGRKRSQYLQEILPEAVRFQYHMIESCGDVYFVEVIYVGVKGTKIGAIQVNKLDVSKLEWVRVNSLGDYSFFISLGSGNSMSRCASKAGVKPNSIYIIERYDRSLYRYDMDERRINRSLPYPNLGPEWGDDWNNGPFWL